MIDFTKECPICASEEVYPHTSSIPGKTKCADCGFSWTNVQQITTKNLEDLLTLAQLAADQVTFGPRPNWHDKVNEALRGLHERGFDIDNYEVGK